MYDMYQGNTYVIMKAMCPPSYCHNGFVETDVLGHMMYVMYAEHRSLTCELVGYIFTLYDYSARFYFRVDLCRHVRYVSLPWFYYTFSLERLSIWDFFNV